MVVFRCYIVINNDVFSNGRINVVLAPLVYDLFGNIGKTKKY